MKKMRLKRKKGSLILEFIIVIPVLYFAAWACMFLIMYSMAQNTMHQAGLEGARILTQELRGNTGKIPNTEEVKTLLRSKVKNSTDHYRYILLFHDESGNAATPQVVIEPSNGCMKRLENATRIICAETTKSTKAGIEQQQIVVYVKSKFHMIANVIPGSKDKIFAQGKGTSEKEFSGRFNYWE